MTRRALHVLVYVTRRGHSTRKVSSASVSLPRPKRNFLPLATVHAGPRRALQLCPSSPFALTPTMTDVEATTPTINEDTVIDNAEEDDPVRHSACACMAAWDAVLTLNSWSL